MKDRGLLRGISVRRPSARKRRPEAEPLEARRLLAITLTQYRVSDSSLSFQPQSITLGPDGNLWFAEQLASKIGVFNPITHSTVAIPTPTANAVPNALTSSPDGDVWFTEVGGASPYSQVASVNPTTHHVTEYPQPNATATLRGIAADASGNLWMTEGFSNIIAEFDPTTQTFTEYTTPTVNSQPTGITFGPGGKIWFTEYNAGQIGEIDPTTRAINEFPINGSFPLAITTGPDGNLWFTETRATPPVGAVGWFNPTTHASGSVATPTPNSDPMGIAAGPGGELAFAEYEAGKIGLIDPTTKVITEYSNPAGLDIPTGMATGPDGNPWFVTGGATIGEVHDLPDTTTTLIVSPNPAYYGTPLTLTATVKPSTGPGTPTGSVFFFDGTTPLGSVPLNGADQASLQVSSLAPGTHSLTAEYEGDTNFAQGTSTPASEVIRVIPTTTTIVPVPNPSTFGHDRVQLVVTVTGPPGGPIPPGYSNFQVFVDGSSVFSGLGYASGVTINYNFLPGLHTISAASSGNFAVAPSASGVSTATVNPGPTTTQLIVSPNPQTTGRPVTLAATITAPFSPFAALTSGTVTFLDGSTPLGTEAFDGDNPVYLTVPSLPAGVHSLTAEFSGTTGFAPSVSAPVAEQIIPVSATTTTLYPSPNPVPYGQLLTLTANVAPAAGGGRPTGVVAFTVLYNGAFSSIIAKVPIAADGTATLVLPSTTVATLLGLYPITAFYSGDANFAPSVSNTVHESIAAPDGPQVLGVARLPGNRGATPLLVAFNEPLHPESAQNTRNYFLTAPGHRKIAIKAAVYDAAIDAVVLTPAAQLAPRQTYLLTVVGTGPLGVTDAEGRRLDGEFIGQPGSNYVNVVGPANPAPKLGATGHAKPNVHAAAAAYRQALAAARRHR
jgi:streptogramin lyase